MKINLKKLAVLVMVSMMLLGVTGCETMKGLGKDISHLGDKIKDKADR